MTEDPNTLFADPDLEWGDSRRMSSFEAMMWRAEADPLLRSHGVVLNILDRAPEWERLVAAHDWGVRRVARLAARVVDDPTRLGPPMWVPAEVDLAYHLQRVTLPAGAGEQDMLAVADGLMMTPFDPARPLWESVLVEGLPGGRAAYVIKLHHSLSDGKGFVQLFDLLFSDRAEATPDKPAPPQGEPEQLEGVDVTVRHALAGARGAPGTLGRLARGVSERTLDAARHPDKAVAYARSFARVTGPPPAAGSPLLAKRGLSRRLSMVDAALAELRAAGKAAGGSLNDAFIAALAGGMRRYHDEHGIAVGELTIALPVSLREASSQAGGNQFAGARIALPAGERDPRRRIELVRERVRRARDEPALDFLRLLAPAMSRVPPPVLARLTGQFTRTLDLQASNIPGLKRRSFVAGARVERMYPFGPVPGCAMMATLLSHEDTCCVGLSLDHTALPDTEGLTRCMREGFDEVLQLAR